MHLATKNISFTDGLRYPWGKPSRLWNILWILLPIFGWFALVGYSVRIMKSLVKGNASELPEFGRFWENFKSGFMFFLKLIPLWIIVALINVVPLIGKAVAFLVQIFLLPYLTLNLVMRGKVSASFEVSDAWKAMTKDFSAYLLVLAYTLLFYLVYGLACLILIGIPCVMFGSMFFFASWFRKNWKY